MMWIKLLLLFCSVVWSHADDDSDEVLDTTPPLPCPKNEQWESCLENLCIAKSCKDLGYPLNCTKVPKEDCTAGCICMAGYLRDRWGKCVPVKDCPSCGGDPNATLGCNNYCKHSCSDYLDVNKDCPPGCVQNGCKCRDGYVYNEILKRCVRPKDCPKSCGPNAIRIRCVIKNPPTCANPNPKPCPNKKEDCTKLGCKCIDGYILDKIGGTCIKVGDCPPSCKDPNAEWKKCGPGCPPSCKNYKNTCFKCNLPCKPGCFCKNGYVLNDKGECIKPKDCPHKCGVNEYWDWCPPNCPHQNCSAIWSKFDCSKAPKCCIPQCRCHNGYYRNDKGICVTIKECLHKCGPHAHYNDCSKVCKSKGCIPGCVCDEGYTMKGGDCVKDSKDCGPNAIKVHCIILNRPTCAIPYPKEPNKLDCTKSGCKCIDGYILDKVGGTCIKVGDCPKSCRDPNAEWKKCGPGCPPSCKNYKNTCFKCNLPCKPGCFCKNGYVLDDKGDCIKPKDCPHKCGVNEYWDWCPPNCPHQNCSAIWSKFDCSKAPKCCIPQCRCRNGYFRNDKGICVTIEECLHKCGPHAHYNDCSNACKSEGCIPGCVCDEGYIMKGGVCVKDCEPLCGKHAHWSECINPCPGSPIPCISGCVCDPGYIQVKGCCMKINKCPMNEEYLVDTNKCQITCKNMHLEHLMGPCGKASGCYCIKDYVRDANGRCIKRTDCPGKCGEHAHWSKCINPCPKGSQCFVPCIAGCLCDKGYELQNGVCVLKHSCKDPLKEWNDCGSACPPSCENYNQTCLSCIDKCVSGCFCKSGLVLNSEGECIVPDDCPRDCGVHEYWDWCPPTCPYQNCSAIWTKIDCRLAPTCCFPQCRCESGYYRSRDGVCVTSDECIKNCGVNAHYNDCSSADEDEDCTPSCDCNKGYIKRGEVCVNEIEGECEENEYWTDCINPCPVGKVCAPCIGGCLCNAGYVKKGDFCVKIEYSGGDDEENEGGDGGQGEGGEQNEREVQDGANGDDGDDGEDGEDGEDGGDD